MIYAKIENGVITERLVFTDPMPVDYPEYEKFVHEEVAQIGWSYSDGVFTPPPPPPNNVPPVTTISDRQFAHALKLMDIITHDEAMAFVQTGTIPVVLASFVSAIPDQSQREDAELLLAGATEFRRHHPATAALAAGLGWTSEQVDELWATATKL